jgi:glutathione S-transferase
MNLYGTPTSPYTRKIRILLAAAKLPFSFVDTRTEEGAAGLARISSVGKVPVLKADALVIPDSGLITAWLWAHHEAALRAAGFSLAPDDWADRERLVVVEGALDAAINRFYLLRDKLPDQGYVTRQGERVVTTLQALDERDLAFKRPLTLSALSLGCALDWMVFRKAADVARFPRVKAFHDAWLASGVGAGTEPAA